MQVCTIVFVLRVVLSTPYNLNTSAIFIFGPVELIKIFHLHEDVILNSCGCFARAVLRSGQISFCVPGQMLNCFSESEVFIGNLWIFLVTKTTLKCPVAFVAGGFSVALLACDCGELEMGNHRNYLLACPWCGCVLAEGHEGCFRFINFPNLPGLLRGTLGLPRDPLMSVVFVEISQTPRRFLRCPCGPSGFF